MMFGNESSKTYSKLSILFRYLGHIKSDIEEV
jgi:hypothetical protein